VGVDAIALKCLAKQPAGRYVSAADRTNLRDWYRGEPAPAGPPPFMRDTQAFWAGVTDPARRPQALEWLHRAETRVDQAFAITHYALLGDADSAFRIAEHYKLVYDFYYLYQLCNIWSPRTAIVRSDSRFAALMQRW